MFCSFIRGYAKKSHKTEKGDPWLEPINVQACLVYVHRIVSHERISCMKFPG